MSLNSRNSKKFIILCVSTVVLLLVCVFLNINLRSEINEDDYRMINVLVVDVDQVYSNTDKYTSEKSINVQVLYNGEQTKLKNSPGSKYNYYKSNINKFIPVCLYKGSLYSAPENIVTTSGWIYFVCLGLFVVCLVLTVKSRPKKQLVQ